MIAQSTLPPCDPSPTQRKNGNDGSPLQLERAYAQLRRLLYLRVLSEGQRLREVEWSHRLGVNRCAVREAMAHLEAEGLLVKSPGRGYAVPVMDADSLGEALEMRALLETEAVRRICRRESDTAESVAQLERVCDQLESLSAQGYCFAVLEADWRFHQLLVRLSGNRRLSAVHDSTPVPLAMGASLGQSHAAADWPTHAEDHRRIVEALRVGDLASAETVLYGHFNLGDRKKTGADKR